MKNVNMQLEGNILTITVDLAKNYGPSNSGKSFVIATSEGNKQIEGTECKIGLNIYRKV